MSNAFDLIVNALRKEGMNSDEILKVLSRFFQEVGELDKESSTIETTDVEIRNLLKSLGMPAHLNGYNYWVEAIRIHKESKNVSITGIYRTIAQRYESTSSRVEKAMRTALECAFERCPKEVVELLFGNSISNKKGTATNSEFLAVLIERV